MRHDPQPQAVIDDLLAAPGPTVREQVEHGGLGCRGVEASTLGLGGAGGQRAEVDVSAHPIALPAAFITATKCRSV
jgi:hypothetical protein